MSSYYVALAFCLFSIAFPLLASLLHYVYRWTIPTRIARYSLMWLSVTFFIPLLLPHIKMVLGCLSSSAAAGTLTPHPFFPSLTCWERTHDILVGVSIATGGLYVFASSMVVLCCYNNEMAKQAQVLDLSIDARTTNRQEFYFLFAKVAMMALFVSSNSSTWKFALSLLLCLTGIAMAIYNLRYLPWWHDTAQTCYLFQALLTAWTGLAGFLVSVTENAGSTAMLYLVFLPLLMAVANMAVRWRYNTICNMRDYELNTALVFQLRCRYKIRTYYNYLAQMGDIYVDLTPNIIALRTDLRERIITLMAIGRERFPESADLHLFIAQFYVEIEFNRVFAYRELQLLQDTSSWLDVRIRANILQRQVVEASNSQQSDQVRAYVEFRKHKDIVEGDIAQAMRALVQFWTELLQPEPRVETLAVMGKTARAYLSQVTSVFEQMLVLHPTSSPTMRLYGQVCAQVLGDTARAEELLELADEVERNKRSQMLESDFSAFLNVIDGVYLDIFDDVNGVITISLSEDSLGHILEVNSTIVKFLGLSSAASVEGRNIDLIMPEPIKTHHDRYLSDFVAAKSGRLMNRTTLVFALGVHGFLLPAQVHIRWADEALGKMIAVLQGMPLKQEVAIIVDPETRQVTYATQNLSSLFGFNKRDILARKLSLTDVIPTLQEDENSNRHEIAWTELNGPKGHQCHAVHAITQQRFDVLAYATLIPVYEDSFYIIRCQVSQSTLSDEVEDPLAEALVPEVIIDAAMARRGSTSSSHSRSSRKRESRPRSRLSGRSSHNATPPIIDESILTPLPLVSLHRNPSPKRPPARPATADFASTPRLYDYPQLKPTVSATVSYTAPAPAPPVSQDVSAFLAQYEGSSAADSHSPRTSEVLLHGLRSSVTMSDSRSSQSSSPRNMPSASGFARPSSGYNNTHAPVLARPPVPNAPDGRSPFAIPPESYLPSLPAPNTPSRVSGNAVRAEPKVESVVDQTAQSTKQSKRKQLARGRYVLLKAIDNDNKGMLERLHKTNVSGIALMLILLGLFITYFIVTIDDVDHAQSLMLGVHDTSLRGSIAMESLYSLGIWNTMLTVPVSSTGLALPSMQSWHRTLLALRSASEDSKNSIRSTTTLLDHQLWSVLVAITYFPLIFPRMSLEDRLLSSCRSLSPPPISLLLVSCHCT
jgi:PAS domain-containing protein